jgi:hypothetical protein
MKSETGQWPACLLSLLLLLLLVVVVMVISGIQANGKV